ncbi:hypothetical protein [Candidatus Nitrosocosmicus arcticus]|uniref:Uncharacterized protein n=1 Tax=Candidatus Nitrosocosmicus arcticus TaxID=2035267 RepID=A0A557SUE0_9ARCH|nr:hypothetical protein [Candidatus Nitrosocosmicus arcticus]TVP40222.1 hypothetical protein NARC_90128 [Candidatus Nitrosocosmicus arcticus]
MSPSGPYSAGLEEPLVSKLKPFGPTKLNDKAAIAFEDNAALVNRENNNREVKASIEILGIKSYHSFQNKLISKFLLYDFIVIEYFRL